LQHLFFNIFQETKTLIDIQMKGNSIGSWSNSKERISGMTSICNFIKINATLVHLDVSNNHLNNTFGQLLASCIPFNSTLIGLHCNSSQFFINSNGDVIFLDSSGNSNDTISTTVAVTTKLNNSNSDNSLSSSSKSHKDNTASTILDCCWSCGKWSWIRICWEEGTCGFLECKSPLSTSSSPNNGDEVLKKTNSKRNVLFVHIFSKGWSTYENWQPIRMKRIQNIDHTKSLIGWYIDKAVPPKETLYYYFSWNNEIVFSNVHPVQIIKQMNGCHKKVHTIQPKEIRNVTTSPTTRINTISSYHQSLYYPQHLRPRCHHNADIDGGSSDAYKRRASRRDDQHEYKRWTKEKCTNELNHFTFSNVHHDTYHNTIPTTTKKVVKELEEKKANDDDERSRDNDGNIGSDKGEEEKLLQSWFLNKFTLFEKLYIWLVAPHHRFDRISFDYLLDKSKCIDMYIRCQRERNNNMKDGVKDGNEDGNNGKLMETETNETPLAAETTATATTAGSLLKLKIKEAQNVMIMKKDFKNIKQIDDNEILFHQLYDASTEQSIRRQQKLTIQKSNGKNRDRSLSSSSMRKEKQHLTASMLRDQHARLQNLHGNNHQHHHHLSSSEASIAVTNQKKKKEKHHHERKIVRC
jgi:hypothetical protein